jgi:hypothetical protein
LEVDVAASSVLFSLASLFFLTRRWVVLDGKNDMIRTFHHSRTFRAAMLALVADLVPGSSTNSLGCKRIFGSLLSDFVSLFIWVWMTLVLYRLPRPVLGSASWDPPLQSVPWCRLQLVRARRL